MRTSHYKFTDDPITCSHCGKETLMYIVCSGTGTVDVVEFNPPETCADYEWKVLMCVLCTEITLIQYSRWYHEADIIGIDENGEELEYQPTRELVLYPMKDISLPTPHPDMPPNVREDYEEAQEVYRVSPRSSAALLRLALQKLCKELGGKGKKIDTDIATLVKRGLPTHIQQALDIVRVIGNESVHPGQIDVHDNPEIAKDLFGLINEIVEDQISKIRRQGKINTLYDSLPKSKLEYIKRRNAKD